MRHKTLPEHASLRALLWPTATPLCSKVEWCLAAGASGLEVLQRVVCVCVCVRVFVYVEKMVYRHVNLGASSMLVRRTRRGE